jgi:hypothetical protein
MPGLGRSRPKAKEMKHMDDENTTLSDREPVALVSSIESALKTLVLAFLAMALAFNWFTWTEAQNAAIIAVIAAVFVLISTVSGIIVRQKVTPTKAPRNNAGRRLSEVGGMQ